jgi:hypothetical protein
MLTFAWAAVGSTAFSVAPRLQFGIDFATHLPRANRKTTLKARSSHYELQHD